MKQNGIVNREKIKTAAVVVGIPSFCEADNIGHVVRQADQGLRKHFPGETAAIVNVDNDSPDNTRQAFLQTTTRAPKVYITTPPGVRGKGNNFHNLFDWAGAAKARAIMVVDADLLSITPDWVPHMLKPIMAGYDYITPVYARSEYDGSITNHICYPLLYGIYGYNLRQPIGGDFSLSGRMAERLLRSRWNKTTKKYGVDIFMTMSAVSGRMKIGQTGLGAKIHKPSAPKLGPMFSQVVTTLFKIIIRDRRWLETGRLMEIPCFGHNCFERPQTVSVDYKGMKATAIFDFRANEDILRRALSKNVFAALKRMFDRETLAIDAGLWRRIVYDAVYAYDKTDLEGGLVEALKPLYFGRFVSFYRDTFEDSSEDCEREIVAQAEGFWREREYLRRKYGRPRATNRKKQS